MPAKKLSSYSLVQIFKLFSVLPKKITLNGIDLTLPEIIAVSSHEAKVEFTDDKSILTKMEESYRHMIRNVKDGIPIYGTNTGYGARASRILNKGNEQERLNLARKISESIVHTDITVGPEFPTEIVKAAMLIRINMLMKGVSGVKLEDLKIYQKMLNKNITPIVNQYGGVGASGDLAHNSRVLSAARQLKNVQVRLGDGSVKDAADILSKNGIPVLHLDPKAGLGLVNGDNFSTAVATILTYKTLNALLLSSVLGALCIEALKGSNRSFHPMLAKVRPHQGQKEIADIYRYLLEGSQLAYQEMSGHKIRPEGYKVQDAYSLRAIAQFHGPNVEKLKSILDTITINANSVSDNPLWVPPEFATDKKNPWKWVSGGNFLAMHMADALDSLRKIMTHIVKLNDRHLARLVNPHESNGLPANLSDDMAISHCAFKGIQIQSGMFEVYSSLLSIPVSTFFGVHEELNQDITSHALTSGILGLENLRLVHYSIAQNLLAVCQAIDLRGGPRFLSQRTKPVYEFVRNKTRYVAKERPLNNEIETIFQSVQSGEISDILLRKVFNNYHHD